MKRPNILCLLALLMCMAAPARAQIIFSKLGIAYKQDFDSLATKGSSASLPRGWYMNQSASATAGYDADSGNASAADVYSYGLSSKSADRALGTISSSSNTVRLGMALTNNTGYAVTSIRLSFTVEQWRLGSNASGRPKDSSYAEASPYATSLNSFGPWLKIPQLNMHSIVTSGTVGPLDGNNSANRATVSFTITGFTVPNGTTIWLRWTDANVSGYNDGLAIDDFQVTVYGSASPQVSFAVPSLSALEKSDSVKIDLNINNDNLNATSVTTSIDKLSTATNGADYAYTPATYTFAPGSSDPVSFYVRIKDDLKIEGNETIILHLRSLTNGAVAGKDSVLTITILDDDSTLSYKIRDAKFPIVNGYSDTLKYGFFQGVVISQGFRPGGLSFFMKDSTGTIEVQSLKKTFGYTPVAGDSVMIRGRMRTIAYQSVILIDTLMKLPASHKTISPEVVTSFSDTTESGLVTIKNVEVLSAWDTTGASVNNGFPVVLKDNRNPGRLYTAFITKGSGLLNAKPFRFPVNLTGIVFQNSKNPANGYYIWIRSVADIDTLKLPLYSIGQLKHNNVQGQNDSAARQVRCYLKGVVQSPSLVSGSLLFSLADNTGAIAVTGNMKNYTPATGDSIWVRGIVTQVNGWAQFQADSIVKTGSSTVPAVSTLSTLDEGHESGLVRLRHVMLADTLQWKAAGAYFSVKVTDKINTYDIRITSATDLYKLKKAPRGFFDITGVEGQNDSTLPYTDNYIIIPRAASDVKMLPLKRYDVKDVKPYNALTGIADSIGVRCYLKVQVTSRNFTNTQALYFTTRDSTAGITITASGSKYIPSMEDTILVRGMVTQHNGLTTFAADSISRLYKGQGMFGGWPMDGMSRAVMADSALERVESNFVNFHRLSRTNKIQWDSTDPGSIYVGKIYEHYNKGNGQDDSILVLVSRTVLSSSSTSSFEASLDNSPYLAGYLLQNDSTVPYLGNYFLVMLPTFWEGIREVSEAHVIQLYPNPAQDNIYIKADGVIRQLRMVSITGQVITEVKPNSGNASLQTDYLPAGIYFIQASGDGFSGMAKFIKK